MINIKKIKFEIENLLNIKLLVETYQEIAAIRMRKVKNGVLRNREFLEGMSDMYNSVLKESNRYKKDVKKGKLMISNSKESKNNKNVSILLSSNTGLYGSIVLDTYNLFLKETSANSTDIVIVGRYAMSMYDKSSLKKPYKFFSFPELGINNSTLRDIISYISGYKNIIVYHGLFKTVLSQQPVKTFLTGKLLDIAEESSTSEVLERNVSFFEPSLDTLIQFFETEILTSLFDQSLHESNLSNLASRMISLHNAVNNAQKAIYQQNYLLKKKKHFIQNSKQQGLLSSVWSIKNYNAKQL